MKNLHPSAAGRNLITQPKTQELSIKSGRSPKGSRNEVHQLKERMYRTFGDMLRTVLFDDNPGPNRNRPQVHLAQARYSY